MSNTDVGPDEVVRMPWCCVEFNSAMQSTGDGLAFEVPGTYILTATLPFLSTGTTEVSGSIGAAIYVSDVTGVARLGARAVSYITSGSFTLTTIVQVQQGETAWVSFSNFTTSSVLVSEDSNFEAAYLGSPLVWASCDDGGSPT